MITQRGAQFLPRRFAVAMLSAHMMAAIGVYDYAMRESAERGDRHVRSCAKAIKEKEASWR